MNKHSNKAAPVMPDLSKFKCFRFPSDGSLYYGEIAFLNTKTGHLAQSGEGDDWKMVRHGYGLNMYSGNRNDCTSRFIISFC